MRVDILKELVAETEALEKKVSHRLATLKSRLSLKMSDQLWSDLMKRVNQLEQMERGLKLALDMED